jgi:hypothetical protein
MVTESLHSALWRIREQKLASVLWADAVCINQSKDEKTTQVRMMQDIYSQADTGIVWLGDSKDTDEAALELMEQVDNVFQDPKVSKTPNYHYIPVRRLGLPDGNSPSWPAPSSFLARPWFTRIWVIQELVSARQLTIQCGRHSVQPEVLFRVAALLHRQANLAVNLASSEPKHRKTPHDEGVTTAIQLGAMKERMDNGDRDELIELCSYARRFKATDPRDKVFVLVGLASDTPSDFIDYNLGVRDISIRLAKMGILSSSGSETTSMNLLSNVVVAEREDGFDVPSWVPVFDDVHMAYVPLASAFPTVFHCRLRSRYYIWP